jgi:hypothetical protein
MEGRTTSSSQKPPRFLRFRGGHQKEVSILYSHCTITHHQPITKISYWQFRLIGADGECEMVCQLATMDSDKEQAYLQMPIKSCEYKGQTFQVDALGGCLVV